MRNPPAPFISLLALALFATPGLSAPLPPVSRPRLAVIVIVDGLSYSRLESYRAWYVGGLKRLLDEGHVETDARHRHLNTETGPGHSSLATGAPPRVTGIVANKWFQRLPDGSARIINAVDQTVPPAVPGGPSLTIPGPGNLRVATLGDQLAAMVPGARVVSLSAKDRSAIFLAGRNPQHTAFWFDQDNGRFVSSAAYDAPIAARGIVANYNRLSAGALLPARFGLVWKKLPLPDPLPSPLPVPNTTLADFQHPVNGVGFDHSFTLHPKGYFASLYTSPVADDLVQELALSFLGDEAFGLGRRDTPDLLAISYSAQDNVSHNYGPDSEENLDVLRRLDLHLGRLLAALDAVGPKGSVLLAFSADHGMPTIPEAERARDPRFKGGRLVNTPRALPNFDERLNRLVAEELCLPPGSRPVFGTELWSLIYNRPALPMRTISGPCGPADRLVTAETLDALLPNLITRVWREEISAVLPVSQRETWPKDNPAVEFALNDFDPERSGDAFLIPRENVLMHWDSARGTHHGSHYDHDTHVPLIFWGGHVPRGRASSPSTPYDLAPTLAAALGVRLPDATGTNRLAR